MTIFFIALLLLISTVAVLILIRKPTVEGLNTTYQQCRQAGYTKEFCLETPLPHKCKCSDGTIGIILPGFRGECICNAKHYNT